MSSLGFPASPPRENRRSVGFWAFGLLTAAIVPMMIWPSLWRDVFSSAYLPHAFCYLSQPNLIWLHLISDSAIGLAYVAISISLVYLVKHARRDIPFHWMFLAFGVFIVSCGMTHFMEVVVLWNPLYWLSGDVKLITALASVGTAVALPLVVPRALALIRERRITLEQANSLLEERNRRLVEREKIKTALAHETVAGVAGWEMNSPGEEITWWDDPTPLFGRPAAELNSLKLLEPVAHPEDRSCLQKLFSEPQGSATESDLECRILWPNGSLRWLALKSRFCVENGAQPRRLVGLATDITNRKLEEALRTSEKLAAAGRLAATIAHEINNPLEAVTNLLFLLRNGHDPEFLGMAEQEVARISHIVKQTLGFYRTRPDPVPVSVDSLIEDILPLFRERIRSRDVKIEKRYRGQIEIEAFSTELSQVFGNLIGNALDAIDLGGTIQVRTAAFRAGVRVTIADNGGGISQENLGKVFQPFFTANKDVGTGLGLWVTQEIVGKHGGSIRVKSSTDPLRHGTVFMIWLPQTIQAARRTAA